MRRTASWRRTRRSERWSSFATDTYKLGIWEGSHVEISRDRDGASQGIGRATAVRLARDFSALALVARNRANLEDTAKAVRAAGAEVLVIDADLAEPRAAQSVVDQTLAAFGRIDALLNIAGAVPQVDLFETTEAQWDAGLALKLHGARRLTIAAWPSLMAAKGAVVLMSGNSASSPRRPMPRSARSTLQSSPWQRRSPTRESAMASRSTASCRGR
ncbi:SDR family NAD(P)-dependent oxidoreductase [Bradyrhizobium japonicum]